jgi:hypothetical protein
MSFPTEEHMSGMNLSGLGSALVMPTAITGLCAFWLVVGCVTLYLA